MHFLFHFLLNSFFIYPRGQFIFKSWSWKKKFFCNWNVLVFKNKLKSNSKRLILCGLDTHSFINLSIFKHSINKLQIVISHLCVFGKCTQVDMVFSRFKLESYLMVFKSCKFVVKWKKREEKEEEQHQQQQHQHRYGQQNHLITITSSSNGISLYRRLIVVSFVHLHHNHIQMVCLIDNDATGKHATLLW